MGFGIRVGPQWTSCLSSTKDLGRVHRHIYICICVSYFDGTNEFYGHIKRPLLSSNDTRINSHVICRGLPEVDCSTYYGECDDDSNWSQGLATPVGGQYPPTPKVSTHPFYIDISIFFYR